MADDQEPETTASSVDKPDAGDKLNKKQLKKKVNSITAFRIIFTGTPQARTTSVSSAALIAAQTPNDKKGSITRRITLDTVRKCGKLPNSYVFCIDDTNTVQDDTILGDYILMIDENITPLSGDVSTNPILTVRYTSRHRRPEKIPPPPTLSSAGKDDNKAAVVENKTPTGVQINTSGLVAGSGGIVSTHPAELNQQEWNYVMVTNSLLHGMFFDKSSSSLRKAREPAFKLNESVPDRFSKPASAPKVKPGDSSGSGAAQPETFHIPAFEVNDESFVKITEVKTTLQLSMAQQGFSSWSAELSASGGVGAYSGGVSASASSSSSTSSASNHGEVKDCLHASYNFPRATVLLDAADLKISDDCQKLLQKIETDKKPEDVTKFYREYGHIFSSRVQLGGRLHATKESDTSTDDKAKTAKSEFKAAVGANFSASFASGSASVAGAKSDGSQSGNKNEKSSESLSWEAQGGETLLGSNPAAWVSTVGSFYNWRVIERSNTSNILALLKDVSGKDWPAIFSKIENVLVSIPGTLPEDVIQIKNDGSSWVQVALSNATSLTESPKFFVIRPGKSNIWKRSGQECVFINAGGSGRVAIAIAERGNYKIQELDYVDPNVEYVTKSDLVGKIGITNNLATTIQVKITTNSGTGVTNFIGVPHFFNVEPGKTEKWNRTDLETIFVKHPASSALFTYLGVSGQDLQINGPSDSSAPKFYSVPGTSTQNENHIRINNRLRKQIKVKVSSLKAPTTSVCETFYPIEANRNGDPWTRTKSEAEVIYVNVPVDGTTVWAYYGNVPCTLISPVVGDRPLEFTSI